MAHIAAHIDACPLICRPTNNLETGHFGAARPAFAAAAPAR
jgi:hypothetical protein